MPKKPLSVTLEDANLLWLRGRAAGRKRRSLSGALDDILTEARRGGRGADRARSVVGTVDIAESDPELYQADSAMRSMFDESLNRPVMVRELAQALSVRPARRTKRRRG